jgi:hypothetical protein
MQADAMGTAVARRLDRDRERTLLTADGGERRRQQQ